MKNLMKVIAFAFVVLFGINNLNAQSLSQDPDRPEVVAKKTVERLDATLDLNGDQERALFRAYTAHTTSYRKHVIGKDMNSPAVHAEKKKIDDALKEKVKATLNEAQFKKWVTLQNM